MFDKNLSVSSTAITGHWHTIMIPQNYIHGVIMMHGTSAADICNICYICSMCNICNMVMNPLDPWNIEFLGSFRKYMCLKADSEPWR